MIDQYVRSFERWTVGSPERRARLAAELRAHLETAREEGELEATLSRLGGPRQAAQAFSERPAERAASPRRRVLAALVDLTPLALLIVASMWQQHWSIFGFGPYAWEPPDPLMYVLFYGSFVWWAVVPTVLEWRTGRTPGKWMTELRVVSVDGTAPSLRQIVVRRLPLVFAGPLQLVDWGFALSGQGQRAFDRVAGTMVVDDR